MDAIISDAFLDTIKMLPLLLAIYVGIELFEYKFGDAIIAKVRNAGAWGPLIGAIAGIFPQCGFSVIATALFTQRLITIGSLLAVYLSTSDEAIPIILSQQTGANFILPLLIIIKLAIAIIAGYAIDFFFKKTNKKIISHAAAYNSGRDDKNHRHETALETPACCGHNTDAKSKKFNLKEIIFHPLIHTAKIFIFIFIAAAAIGILISRIGQTAIEEFFYLHNSIQPIIAAFIGLIPNCAASVAITELYLKGIINFGAAISGLCAGAGLGVLVLIREEKNKKIVLLVIALLLSISIAAGFIINL